MQLDSLNRAEAFRYMGHKGGEIPENINALADECEGKLLAAIRPNYVWRVFDIAETDGGISVSGTSLVLTGNDITEHLRGCERCVLMCATLSIGADSVIRAYESAEMEKAVIADCLASAAIEQVCDIAEREIQASVGDYNYTWRFSPGYGDLPLELQRRFIEVLQAQKRIGVTVTDSLILIPRKSVTAVMGISTHEISKGRRGCGSCNMRETCQFRKNGTRCTVSG